MINPNNNFNSSSADEDCRTKLAKLWNLIPLFIRFLVLITIVIYLLDLFVPFISFSLSNIPLYTIFYFQIWRLITTVFITTSILNIILILVFWVRDASGLESKIGTIKYMIIFFMNSILIQIIYCFLSGLIALVCQNKMIMASKLGSHGRVQNSGLWPLIMCEMTLLCMANPNSSMKILFFPCQFKAKFYPLIIFVFFCFLNSFLIDLEVLSGIIYGYLYHFFLKNKLKISNELINKIERSVLCKWITKLNGFCINMGGDQQQFVPYAQTQNGRTVNISDGRKSGFNSFGGKGTTVGGTLGKTTADGYDGVSENSVNQSVPKPQLESLDEKIKSDI